MAQMPSRVFQTRDHIFGLGQSYAPVTAEFLYYPVCFQPFHSIATPLTCPE